MRTKKVSCFALAFLLSACSDVPIVKNIKSNYHRVCLWNQAEGIIFALIVKPKGFDSNIDLYATSDCQFGGPGEKACFNTAHLDGSAYDIVGIRYSDHGNYATKMFKPIFVNGVVRPRFREISLAELDAMPDVASSPPKSKEFTLADLDAEYTRLEMVKELQRKNHLLSDAKAKCIVGGLDSKTLFEHERDLTCYCGGVI